MMPSERDLQRLAYIAESIRLIEEYLDNSRDRLLHDRMVQDAVLCRLETLADASNKLPPSIKERHPEIAWRDAYGFRNVAAHAYEYIEIIRVWEIIEKYLPLLKAAVATELQRAELTKEGGPDAQ